MLEIEELQEQQEEKELKESYLTRSLKKSLKEGDIFRAVHCINSHRQIPTYYICNESNVEYRKYQKALYGHDQLEDQEIQRLINWIIEYFGLNLGGCNNAKK